MTSSGESTTLSLMTPTRYVADGDPILTVWNYGGINTPWSALSELLNPPWYRAPRYCYGGTSPSDTVEFLRSLARHGHAAVTDSRYRTPTNHRVIGEGVGHDDARFAETGGREGSMAAYYENGEGFRGRRWWEDTDDGFSAGVKYYGCQYTGEYSPVGHPTRAAETIRRRGLTSAGASPTVAG